MRTPLFLSLSLVVLVSACSVLTDFSDDGNNNNANNNNNVNEEVCGNRADDDGDGFIDCDDTDCAGSDLCECRLDNAFFDSIDGCPLEEACVLSLTQSGVVPECVPQARVEGGIFYGQCGISEECPFGSSCEFNYFTSKTECIPFCSPAHPKCPEQGSCSFFEIEELPPDTIRTCFRPDNCDPTDSGSCGGEDGCYLMAGDGGTKCLPSGTGVVLSSCTEYTECRPGNVCFGAESNNGHCLRWCRVNDEDPCGGLSGAVFTCLPLSAEFGVCVAGDK